MPTKVGIYQSGARTSRAASVSTKIDTYQSAWSAQQGFQHGHAHGDAVGDLAQHPRLRAVGHVVGHFHAAVDRARVQHRGILPRAPGARGSGRTGRGTAPATAPGLLPCARAAGAASSARRRLPASRRNHRRPRSPSGSHRPAAATAGRTRGSHPRPACAAHAGRCGPRASASRRRRSPLSSSRNPGPWPGAGQHVQQALGRVRAATVTGVDQCGALARRFCQCGYRAILRVAHPHAHRFQVAQRIAAVSPLRVDEVEASKLSTSAPRRCAASWNELRVRVDGSKNSVHTAEPASTWRLLPTRPTAASRI